MLLFVNLCKSRCSCMTRKANLAIFSPSNNSYSETFIQAHRCLNNGDYVFYYGSLTSLKLENSGLILSKIKKGFWRFIGLMMNKKHFDVSVGLLRSFKKNNVKIALIEYGTFAADLLPHLLFSKIPFIVHFHGYDASTYTFLDKYSLTYKDVFIQAKYIIVVSRQMENKLLELGCPRDKLIYNVYGPNNVYFTTQPIYRSDNFLSVGRFVNKKAPYYVILSFIKVIESFPQAKLMMIGDGPMLSICKNIVNAYNLTENIIFLGRKEPKEILSYLENSIAFIQHSIVAEDGDTEGTPLSILEAAAAALPVISTYHGGIPDVITDGKTGFLVKEHDVIGMSEKIKELLFNPNIAVEMGQNSRSNIRDNFSLDKHLNKINELISQYILAN
jgi:colanic acid/amylovoran biosynthesis glycosyltransferase